MFKRKRKHKVKPPRSVLGWTYGLPKGSSPVAEWADPDKGVGYYRMTFTLDRWVTDPHELTKIALRKLDKLQSRIDKVYKQ